MAIWADPVAEGFESPPCVDTVYTSVYAGVLEVKANECLRMRRPPAPVSSGPPRQPAPVVAEDRRPARHGE